MMRVMTSSVLACIKAMGLLIMAGLVGCASPARIAEMSVQQPVAQTATSPFQRSIAVMEVTGGRETNPMWSSQVSSDSFQRALEISLQNLNLSDPVKSANRYHLTADILEVSQPMLGLDITVTTVVRYSLVNATSRKEIFSKVINAAYTAKMSDALVGTERMRLANEGAARANIKLLTDELLRQPAP